MEPVIENDAHQPTVPDGQGGKGKEETVTVSKAELESMRRERDEARESERYWAERARAGSRPAEPAGEPESDEDPTEFIDPDQPDGIEGDTAEKLIEELQAKGVKALRDRGFVTAAQANKMATETALKVSRELIGRERQKITSDATLMNEFPDLRNPESELFKETAKHYQRAVAMDPNAKKTPAALYLAAAAARESLKVEKPIRRTQDEDRYREDEADRRQRASSQDGRGRGRGDVDDRDDMLGDEARQVIRSMGITEEEFIASRKATGKTGRR